MCGNPVVSDAQTEGKMSVAPKSSLPRNNRKKYYNTFVVSTELAYGQSLQEPPKNIGSGVFKGRRARHLPRASPF